MFLIHMFVSSNLHKLRDFIKHVYLDRKYTGDKRIDKLSKLRLVSSSLLYMHAHGSYLSWVALLDLLYEENQCSNPPSSTCNNWIMLKKKEIIFVLWKACPTMISIYNTGQLKNFGSHQYKCDGN